ncbi:Uncharacterised protein [Mycobacteroides abscessus]|nr:Uncharacterised protein [Mycobacteroides abscessus]
MAANGPVSSPCCRARSMSSRTGRSAVSTSSIPFVRAASWSRSDRLR